MEKEFIPYDLSLELKELGFDEPCFKYFDPLLGDYTIMNNDCINPKPTLFNHNSSSIVVSAPLYQQAFRWFREKYGNFYDILQFYGGLWGYSIYGQVGFEGIFVHNKFNTYEEAELECLKKLIEIVKEK